MNKQLKYAIVSLLILVAYLSTILCTVSEQELKKLPLVSFVGLILLAVTIVLFASYFKDDTKKLVRRQ